jgi:hypothetical protein
MSASESNRCQDLQAKVAKEQKLAFNCGIFNAQLGCHQRSVPDCRICPKWEHIKPGMENVNTEFLTNLTNEDPIEQITRTSPKFC